MRVHDVPAIAQLSTAEKILFVEDLWESIADAVSEGPVPSSHRDALDSRLQSYEVAPGNLLSLEELQNRLESQ